MQGSGEESENLLYLTGHPRRPNGRRGLLTPTWGVVYTTAAAGGSGGGTPLLNSNALNLNLDNLNLSSGSNLGLSLASANQSILTGSRYFTAFPQQTTQALLLPAIPSTSSQPPTRTSSDASTYVSARENCPNSENSGNSPLAPPAADRRAGRPRGSIDEIPTPICFDFAQGRCTREDCRYSHDWEMIIRHNSREKRACFDYLRGECNRRNLCRFSHDVKPLVKQWLEEAAARGVPAGRLFFDQPSGNGICYDFIRNECRRGLACPWSHNLLEIAYMTARDKGKFMRDQIQLAQTMSATTRLLRHLQGSTTASASNASSHSWGSQSSA